MRVGYLGNFSSSGLSVSGVVSLCVEKGLDFFVLCGNISDNYKNTLEIVNKLGWELSGMSVNFRFVIGNTDLYYPEDEYDVDKERCVRKILNLYNGSKYNLDNNPIVFGKTVFLSGRSHYDFTYYRGKPIELSRITRKRKWWYKNRDVVYLTSYEDYTKGVKNVFDVLYTRELNISVRDRLNMVDSRYGMDFKKVVCTNIVPHRDLLGDGVLSGYRGTFEGNVDFHSILKSRGVSECHFGSDSCDGFLNVDGVGYYGCYRGVDIVEY